MLRIALVAGPDPGHALPIIGLGAALVRRGIDVICWTGREHLATGRSRGMDVRELPRLSPSDEDADLGYRFWGRAVEMAPRLADEMRAWQPDVVVADTLLRAGGLAAQLLDVPAIELIPHHLPDPSADLPPVGLGRRRRRTPLGRAQDRLLVRLQFRSIAVGREQGRSAAAALGLMAPTAPALRLLATLPGLERPRSRWPADAHVVGPLAVDPDLPVLQPPPGDAPLVVVTDTTAPGVHARLGRNALEGLRHLDVRIVVTSTQLPAERTGNAVVGTGPHLPLLAQAAVAVGPGGAGFLSKATASGVPMVVVPIQGDQLEAAARLRDARAGVFLRARDVGPRRLAWAVARLLADPAARRAAAGLARQAAALGPDLAADLVVRVTRGERPEATGPSTHLSAASRSGPPVPP